MIQWPKKITYTHYFIAVLFLFLIFLFIIQTHFSNRLEDFDKRILTLETQLVGFAPEKLIPPIAIQGKNYNRFQVYDDALKTIFDKLNKLETE